MQDNWDVATGLTGTEWVDSLFLQTAAMQSKSVRYSYCSHHVWNIESSEINFFKFRIIFGNLNFDHHRMRDGVYSHSFRIRRSCCPNTLPQNMASHWIFGCHSPESSEFYPVSSPHQACLGIMVQTILLEGSESNCREFSYSKSKQIDIPHCCLRH